jgi:hypothetical protein
MKTWLRRALLVSLVGLSACAAFDAPTIKAGNTVCAQPERVRSCAELKQVAASLHTPEMEKAIREARQ